MKKLIEITCPECGATQSEPPRVISTCCHRCGVHIAVAEPRRRKKEPRKARHDQDWDGERGGAGNSTKGSGLPVSEFNGRSEEPSSFRSTAEAAARRRQSNELLSSPTTTDDGASTLPPQKQPLSRLAALRRSRSTSSKAKCCYQCGGEQIIREGSNRTFCPVCAIYIDLDDIAIHERSTRPVQTFGNVTIHKGAASLGSTIFCHHLFVHGELTSRVRATGTVTFWSSGVVLGQIDCDRLIVDRSSSLRFVQRVTARTIEIHGSVVGEFVSEGDVLLSRRASLSGVVAGKTFEMNLAAELLARMEFHP